MPRTVRAWIRIVFTPDWILWTMLAAVPSLWLIYLFSQWFVIWLAVTTAPTLSESERFVPEVPPFHQAALPIIAGVYGLLRGSLYHPINRKAYGTWLAETPWQYPQPLPLGPVHLAWQDLFALAGITSFALIPPALEFSALIIPLVFLIAYCAAMGHTLIRLRFLWIIVPLVLAVAFGIFFHAYPLALLLGAVALYGVVCIGTAASLKDFPYTPERRERLGLIPYEKEPAPPIALPIVPTQDDEWFLRATHGQALWASAAFGCLFIAGAYQFQDEPALARPLLTIHTWIVLFAIAARLFLFCHNALPPISLFGRLATGRLVIPGYDKVFVAPFAAALAAFALPLVLLEFNFSPVLAVPIATATTLYLLMVLPPDLEQWHYTGHFRIPAPRRYGKEVVHV